MSILSMKILEREILSDFKNFYEVIPLEYKIVKLWWSDSKYRKLLFLGRRGFDN